MLSLDSDAMAPQGPDPMTAASVSVIIPVYNDDERLRLCLNALTAQTYPHNQYEVIIVDNGSRVAPKWVENEFPGMVLAQETQVGSYAARNCGIALAKGQILAFTDSDCIPDPDWILNGVHELLSGDNVGLVGGHIDFMFRDTGKPRIAELYDSITYLQQRNAIEHTKFAATANMFTRRAVLDRVGPFDVTVKSGGDRDWGQRVAAAGYELRYRADAVVAHPARATFGEIIRKNVRVLGGHHQWRSGVDGRRKIRELVRELAEDLSPPVRFAGRIARDDRVKGMKNKILVTAMHWLAKLVNAWTSVKLQCGTRPSRS